MKARRTHSDEELRLIEAFFLNSFDGIFIVDNDGKLLLTNPAIEQILNENPTELVGRYVNDLMNNGVYAGSPTMQSIDTKVAYTGLVKTRAGTEIVSTSKPILDENGKVKLLVTNCRPLKPLIDFLNSCNAGKAIKKYDPAPKSIKRNLIYKSEIMRDIIKTAEKFAKSDSAVIIYGETGTGKGMLANFIHEQSYRGKGNMVEINCAAIPENLIESELFGYEKGAFTGASASGKRGLFEIADDGTLFLDEIGEMPLVMQAKLLKVLDAGYIMRVGGTVSIKVNTRVIGATNQDLKSLVRQRKFREDLYYRMNTLPIHIPPLRKRRDDIPPLLESTLKEVEEKYGEEKKFLQSSIDKLLRYDWPGNVRQLKNIVEYLYILSSESDIDIGDLLDSVEGELFESDPGYEMDCMAESDIQDLKTFMKNIETNYIDFVSKACGGSISKTARKLGIHRTALYKKLRKTSCPA